MSAKIVSMKQGCFRDELMVEFEEETLSSCINWIKRFMKKKNISENAITKIIYERKIEEDGSSKNTIVRITYFTIDLIELRAKPKEEQIRLILNKIGYDDSAIKKIEYRKYYSNDYEKRWVASIIDPEFDYYPDEGYAEREHKNSIYSKFAGVFNFQLILDISKQ